MVDYSMFGAAGAIGPLGATKAESHIGFYGRYGKRIFDLVFAGLIAVPIALVIGILWLMIRRDGGAGFFSHERIGRDGVLFRCYKLRTMAVDAEQRLERMIRHNPEIAAEWAEHQKLKQDPRITKLGSFLRKTSLDELPQLINVFKGEMSLVGPRPVVKDELSRYGQSAKTYKAVLPGITGLWQVKGRNSVSYETRVAFDTVYVSSVSFFTDISILFDTVGVVLRRTGR